MTKAEIAQFNTALDTAKQLTALLSQLVKAEGVPGNYSINIARVATADGVAVTASLILPGELPAAQVFTIGKGLEEAENGVLVSAMNWALNRAVDGPLKLAGD